MDSHRLKEVQDMIKWPPRTPPMPVSWRNLPVGAGSLSDDLSKVASNDVIGKGGDPTDVLRK